MCVCVSLWQWGFTYRAHLSSEWRFILFLTVYSFNAYKHSQSHTTASRTRWGGGGGGGGRAWQKRGGKSDSSCPFWLLPLAHVSNGKIHICVFFFQQIKKLKKALQIHNQFRLSNLNCLLAAQKASLERTHTHTHTHVRAQQKTKANQHTQTHNHSTSSRSKQPFPAWAFVVLRLAQDGLRCAGKRCDVDRVLVLVVVFVVAFSSWTFQTLNDDF